MRLSMQQRIMKELHIQPSIDPKNEIQKENSVFKRIFIENKVRMDLY